MKKVTRNILAVAGVISTIIGIIVAIPSFLQNRNLTAIAATILIVGGLVLLAIAFGDE